MAELSAVAAVIQVAQFGAQLSLALYNVAQTVKFASQDVKRIAKDVALFAQVLKDLDLALERGQGSTIYRADAYETSRMIVEECKALFEEIETTLKKATKEAKPLEAKIAMSKVERFFWVFRKGRVQLLQSNLESLKSTISLQLAVLTYAAKRAPSDKHCNDMDDILSLKSLVLANDTATCELRELNNSTTEKPEPPKEEESWNPGPLAMHGIWDSLPSKQLLSPSTEGQQLSATTPGIGVLPTPNVAMQPDSAHYDTCPSIASIIHPYPTSNNIGMLGPETHQVRGPTGSLTAIAADGKESLERPKHIWGHVDKLKLALKKLDTAKWELERIQMNVKLGRYEEHAEKQFFLLRSLQYGLEQFGLSTEQIRWATNSLVELDQGFGKRTEISYMLPKSNVSVEMLQSTGVAFETLNSNHTHFLVNRWLPEYFEDILWSHVKHSAYEIQHQMMAQNKQFNTSDKSTSQVHQPVKATTLPVSATQSSRPVTKKRKLHQCEYSGCDKVFTRAEHRRRHELNHSPEPYQCGVASCQKSFHRLDLLTTHMERQHNESERGYCHRRSLSQVSGTALDPATVIATTVSPTAILNSNTQLSSAMSIYSTVDTTPSGFVTQPMGPFNDLAQIPVPSGPHGFAPDLVYGAASTSDESTIYWDDSCYSPNTDYSRAHIASQPYLPGHEMQHDNTVMEDITVTEVAEEKLLLQLDRIIDELLWKWTTVLKRPVAPY